MLINRIFFPAFAAFFLAGTAVAVAQQALPPDIAERHDILLGQRERMSRAILDLQLELEIERRKAERRESEWAEYSRPLWDRRGEEKKPAELDPGPPP